MSRHPVVIEVSRGPVIESRHEGAAAIVKPDGTVVESWGDIDTAILPRSATKPIQALPFVESGAVERFDSPPSMSPWPAPRTMVNRAMSRQCGPGSRRWG